MSSFGIIDYDYFIVVLEVDENQHKSYECICEQQRMIQIHQDIGMNILFIRFNPDSYRNINNELINNYNDREKKLLNILKNIKKLTKMKNPLSVMYLYYDNYDEHKEKENIMKIHY